MNFNIKLQPKQSVVLNKVLKGKAKFIGYGGARGGGKSALARRIAVIVAFKYHIPVLIFRRMREELLNNHVYKFFQEFPELYPYFNKTEFTIFRPGYPNEVLIKFGYSEGEDEIAKFQGTEWGMTIVDEATQSTWKMIKFLESCTRAEIPDYIAKVILTFNPGGVGHTDIKTRFIDKIYRDENETPESFDFVQSSVWDNVYWVHKALTADNISISTYYHTWTEQQRIDYCLDRSDYAAGLKSQDEETRKAWLWGDWDVYGGLFFKTFSPAKQIIEPFEIPEGWNIYAGLDPGFSSPCSFPISAQDYSGNIYHIYTYSEAERNAYEHAQAIKTLLESKDSILYPFLKGRKPKLIAAGLDAWAKKDRYAVLAHEKTFADVFTEHGLHLTRAVTDRINGWRAIKTLFPDKYFFFKEFTKSTTHEILAVESDKRNPEDILGRGNNPEVSDHDLDAMRYMVMSSFKPRVFTPEPKIQAGTRAEAIEYHTTTSPIASF